MSVYWPRRDDPDQCWQWLGYIDNRGYGRVSINGIPAKIHYAVWYARLGPPEKGVRYLACPISRSCANPHHSGPGTTSDVADKRLGTLGRSRRPVQGPKVRKLTDPQVLEIYASTDTQEALAARYRVSQMTISKIKRGILYRTLTQKEVQDG